MMSKCGSCGGLNMFSLKEVSPTESRYKFYFIQCSLCGVPVGVVNYFNDHESIVEIDKKLKDLNALERKVDKMDRTLSMVLNVLNNQR